MDETRSSDLTAFRQIALFTVGLGAALALAMQLFRIGLPSEWPVLGVTWLMLAAAVLLPLAAIERFHRPGSGWRRDLLVGPGVVAGILGVFALGLLGRFGLIPIGAAAAWGLWAALNALVRRGNAARTLLYLVLILVLLVPLVLSLDGTKYANLIADRLMLFGRADGDTMFHGALINSLRTFGTIATGIDGIRPFSYHVGIHLLAAQAAQAAGASAVPALIALRTVFAAPLLVYAAACGGVVWCRWRGGESDRPIRAIAFAVLLLIGLPATGIGIGSMNSESLVLAAAALMLALPPFLLAASSDGLGRIAWIAGVAMILPLGAAKISFGMVWAGLLGWWALRQFGPRRVGFWATGILIGAIFLLAMRLFSPSADVGAAYWFSTPYYVETAMKGYPLEAITLNIEGLAVMLIMAAAWRRPTAATAPGFGSRQAGQVLESFAIILLLANLPGLLMRIEGGDAIYFIQVFAWAAKPLLLGEILRLPDLAKRSSPGWSARLPSVITWIGVIACVAGLIVQGERQLRIIVNTEALIRTGDPQYYAGTSQNKLRKGMEVATETLGWSGILTAPPPRAPGADFADALLAWRATAGNAGGIYVAPQTKDYWSLVEDCDGKSLLPMAIAGLPMIDGYYPDQAACRQEIALSGYGSPPADTGQALDDPGICARAKASGIAKVLVISAISPALQTRELSCLP